MKDEEFNTQLQRGQEVLERWAALQKRDAKLQQATVRAGEVEKKRSQQALDDMHKKSDDIHKDYLESSQRESQRVDDLHRRRLALLDIQIERAKAIAPAETKLSQAAKAPNVGQRIDALRLKCGWTQEELAEETGRLGAKQVHRHISGKAKPHPSTLKLYADTFTRGLKRPVSIDELVS